MLFPPLSNRPYKKVLYKTTDVPSFYTGLPSVRVVMGAAVPFSRRFLVFDPGKTAMCPGLLG